VQNRHRRGRAKRNLLALAVLALLVVSRCAVLYTAVPRYARSKPRPKPKPTATKPGPKRVPVEGKGTLPWPVQGQVVTQFGNIVDPRYGTVTKSSGIDILTKSGSPVLAVDSGKVSFADIFIGYGRMVIIDHGNRSHSIYSKLSDVKVKVGAFVARGATIAVSGDTLHFEFRVGGKSVDPLEWLALR
jgi:septal ring factor EnvC (AmiA/AmiB activator)